MGVTNLCKLLDCIVPPSVDLEQPFDSILVDVQSYLYTSMYYAFETEEKAFVREVCQSTWDQISKMLFPLLASDRLDKRSFTLVFSFDGVGVPMKWPTQRQRRCGTAVESLRGKRLYQSSLFGINAISLKVQDSLVLRLRQLNLPHVERLTSIVSGCNVPGEGEHKLFHIAESWEGGCQRPLVVSVDQDVFVIALMRRHRYESIQIFRYNKVYDISGADPEYPWEQFIVVSILFGNDFAPCLVPITDANAPAIHTALLRSTTLLQSDDDTPELEALDPVVVHAFLRRLRLKFERVSYVDRSLLVQFWLCYLWVRDYYTMTEFPQKHMENFYYDRFDRNQVLTGLCNLNFSRETYDEAVGQYATVQTSECQDHASAVFLDPDLRGRLQRFWSTLPERDTVCDLIRVERRTPKRSRSKRARDDERAGAGKGETVQRRGRLPSGTSCVDRDR